MNLFEYILDLGGGCGIFIFMYILDICYYLEGIFMFLIVWYRDLGVREEGIVFYGMINIL